VASKRLNIIIAGQDTASSVLKGFSSSVSSTLVKIAALYTAYLSFQGLGNIFINAASSVVAFEDQLAKVLAITGDAGAGFDRLEQTAKQLGATTRFTGTQAAQGMEELARAGFNTDQIIEALSDTLALAQGNAITLGDASNLVAQSIRAFGLDVDQAGKVADTLTLAAARSNTTVMQLGDALSYASPSGSAFGVEMHTVAAAIGLMADAGIKGSRAGTALNKFFIDAMNPASKFSAALNDAGITTRDFDSILRALASRTPATEAALVSLGTRAGPGMRALLGQGVDAFKELESQLALSEGAAQKAAAIMDNTLQGALYSLASAWDAVGQTLLSPALQPAQDAVTALADELRTFASSQTAQQMADAFAQMVASIGQSAAQLVSSVDFQTFSQNTTKSVNNVISVLTTLGVSFQNLTTGLNVTVDILSTAMKGVLLIGNAFAVTFSAISAGFYTVVDGAANLGVAMGLVGQDIADASTSMKDNAMGMLDSMHTSFQDLAVSGVDSLGKLVGGMQPVESALTNLDTTTQQTKDSVAVTWQSLDQLGSSLTALANPANSAVVAFGDLGDASSKSSAPMGDVAGSADLIATKLNALTNTGASDEIQSVGNAATQASPKIEPFAAAVDTVKGGLTSLDGGTASSQLSLVANAAATSAPDVSNLAAPIKAASDALQGLDGTTASTQLNQVANTASITTPSIQGLATPIRDASNALSTLDATQAAQALGAAATAANQASPNVTTAGDAFDALSNNIAQVDATTLTSSLGGVGSAATNVTGQVGALVDTTTGLVGTVDTAVAGLDKTTASQASLGVASVDLSTKITTVQSAIDSYFTAVQTGNPDVQNLANYLRDTSVATGAAGDAAATAQLQLDAISQVTQQAGGNFDALAQAADVVVQAMAKQDISIQTGITAFSRMESAGLSLGDGFYDLSVSIAQASSNQIDDLQNAANAAKSSADLTSTGFGLIETALKSKQQALLDVSNATDSLVSKYLTLRGSINDLTNEEQKNEVQLSTLKTTVQGLTGDTANLSKIAQRIVTDFANQTTSAGAAAQQIGVLESAGADLGPAFLTTSAQVAKASDQNASSFSSSISTMLAQGKLGQNGFDLVSNQITAASQRMADQVGNNFQSTIQAASGFSSQIAKNSTVLQGLDASIQQVGSSQQGLETLTYNLAQAFRTGIIDTNTARQGFDSLSQAGVDLGTSYNALKDKVRDATQATAGDIMQAANAAVAAGDLTSTGLQVIQAEIKNLDAVSPSLQGIIDLMRNMGDQAAADDAVIQGTTRAINDMGTSQTALLSIASQLASAFDQNIISFTGVTAAVQVLKNAGLSLGSMYDSLSSQAKNATKGTADDLLDAAQSALTAGQLTQTGFHLIKLSLTSVVSNFDNTARAANSAAASTEDMADSLDTAAAQAQATGAALGGLAASTDILNRAVSSSSSIHISQYVDNVYDLGKYVDIAQQKFTELIKQTDRYGSSWYQNSSAWRDQNTTAAQLAVNFANAQKRADDLDRAVADLQFEFNNGSLTLGDYNTRLTFLQMKYRDLGKEKLIELRDALADAKVKTDQLRAAADSALLAALQAYQSAGLGNTQAQQLELQRMQTLNDLQQQLNAARAAGDSRAIQSIQQAIKLQEQAYQARQNQINNTIQGQGQITNSYLQQADAQRTILSNQQSINNASTNHVNILQNQNNEVHQFGRELNLATNQANMMNVIFAAQNGLIIKANNSTTDYVHSVGSVHQGVRKVNGALQATVAASLSAANAFAHQVNQADKLSVSLGKVLSVQRQIAGSANSLGLGLTGSAGLTQTNSLRTSQRRSI
jgi:TP901 family phage tail tape measure protein